MRVAEDLHFDVLGPRDVALDEDIGLAEGRSGFALRFFELAQQLIAVAHHAHAAPAAAEAGFDDQREADFFRGGFHFRRHGDGFGRAGDGGHIGFVGQMLGRDFVAEHFQVKWSWADKFDLVHFAGAGEVGILRKKSVTRMNRIDLVLLGQGDDVADVEIRFDRLAATGWADQK